MSEAEIVRHHRVIERWLTGAADPSEFAAFERAHAPGFTMITPAGRTLSRAEVMEWVRGAYGSAPGLRIEITDVRTVVQEGPLTVCVYLEWQSGASRTSTVVLRDGVSWEHLHESG
ncbi:nuclear transport factor 2 family protein [Nonomuraea sp. NPDC050556]|uniref:nuclear transport factor 2 family protein n=1 Tax=Nonomuraea sp. NPDC050556 TaxID=3364369 RepID=UPI00378E859E